MNADYPDLWGRVLQRLNELHGFVSLRSEVLVRREQELAPDLVPRAAVVAVLVQCQVERSLPQQKRLEAFGVTEWVFCTRQLNWLTVQQVSPRRYELNSYQLC